MFQSTIIGNLGGDAVVRNESGREFITFRVAHNERYQDADGTKHETTLWIDCVMNGKPNVTQFLKAGQMVFVQGSTSIRMYDSAVDRCKKATARISVQRVELLGSASDKVPSTLYDDDGASHTVTRIYYTDFRSGFLKNRQGERFGVDDYGWVVPESELPTEVRESLKTESNE